MEKDLGLINDFDMLEDTSKKDLNVDTKLDNYELLDELVNKKEENNE